MFAKLLLFNPSHSNIFADYENNLPINPLFCRQDGVGFFFGGGGGYSSHMHPTIATALMHALASLATNIH